MLQFNFASKQGPYNRTVNEYMYLKNPTNQRIAYKVKILEPNWYHVKPFSGILPSGSSATITLALRPLVKLNNQDITKDKFDPSKQIFMVESAFVEDEKATNVLKIVSFVQ